MNSTARNRHPRKPKGNGPGVFVPQHVIAVTICLVLGLTTAVLVLIFPTAWPPVGAGIEVAGFGLALYASGTHNTMPEHHPGPSAEATPGNTIACNSNHVTPVKELKSRLGEGPPGVPTVRRRPPGSAGGAPRRWLPPMAESSGGRPPRVQTRARRRQETRSVLRSGSTRSSATRSGPADVQSGQGHVLVRAARGACP